MAINLVLGPILAHLAQNQVAIFLIFFFFFQKSGPASL